MSNASHNLTNPVLIRLPGEAVWDAAATAAAQTSTVVFRDAPSAQAAAIRSTPTARGLAADTLIGAEWWVAERAEEAIAEAVQAEVTVWVEVRDDSEALTATAAGAHRLVVCGFEGGGMVGHDTTLVLLRRVLAVTPANVPVVARGGVGPDTAAGCLAAGADGVMLDVQLWAATDAPTSDVLRGRLDGFNPLDTACFGLEQGFRFRTFGQLATRAVREVQKLEGAGGMSRTDLLNEVQTRLAPSVRDVDMKNQLVPLGQDAAFACPMAERWGTIAGILEGLRAHMTAQERGVAAEWPWAPGQGISSTNSTALPFHQGPMAQVADVPAFAKAVADSGSMPWLALANMPGHIARKLVEDTAAACPDATWGAGIIGLDANHYRDAHIAMLKELKPPFVLVAAGTMEQALDIERAGIKTYLHTPTPGLLRAALESGLTRFILEGTEAGGHVGSIGGLVLWQLGIFEVERALAAGVQASDLAFVPAGGISDAASARALATTLWTLNERGVKTGLQMGTAYLMCDEAVETGAVSDTYRDAIAGAKSTLLMGETVGAPTRVLPTNQAHVVFETEFERRSNSVSLKDRKHLYEKDNLGGLRAAAKAQRIASIDPEKGAIFENVDEATQLETGLFHAGQGVALINGRTRIADLHGALIDAASIATPRGVAQVTQTKRPQAPAPVQASTTSQSSPDDIAIVGLGTVMPDAPDVAQFWSNLLSGHCAIGDVPSERWDADFHWTDDRQEPDTTYSKIGGFVRDFNFDRKAFRVPPMVVKSLDLTQLYALEAGRQALADAGLLEPTEDFDRTRCAVVIGNSMGGDLRVTTAIRTELRRLSHQLDGLLKESGLSDDKAAQVRARFDALANDGRPPITEDTMPGELPNCTAGRVASTFDLGGPNWVVDAACASSLAALDVAVNHLRRGTINHALVGGSDAGMGVEGYVKFSKIGALSADGSRPFDASANGFVMGEGAGMMVLMRRADAEAEGRKVYAIIKGIGASSDGRGKGITAPNPSGQRRAIERAYEDAAIDPKTVTYFEAHGTGTPVGDPVEVNSLIDVVGQTHYGASLGSVKSNIGHLKAAAGAAAMTKVALALYHKVLPPTLGVTTPNPKLPLQRGNLHLQLTRENWQVPTGIPRRASVSAFGFGGTNLHVVLEEANGPLSEGIRMDNSSSDKTSSTPAPMMAASAGTEAPPVAAAPTAAAPAGDRDAIYAKIVTILCERTGYEADEIEPDFELEADLGVDTVKQAEIMAQVREVYSLERDADFRLAEYPTISSLADYVISRMGQGPAPEPTPPTKATVPAEAPPAVSAPSTVGAPESRNVWAALDGLITLGATDRDTLVAKLTALGEALKHDGLAAAAEFHQGPDAADAHSRVALAFEPSAGAGPLAKLVEKAGGAIAADKGLKILANRGVHFAEGPSEGKVAFLFPGQGSQYLGMGADLAERFTVVQETFDEADAVMSDVLDAPLTSYFLNADFESKEASKAAFIKLTQTEITQPAVLAVDTALLRLVKEFGFRADMVAGHSLGEYGACVASDVMSFESALRTVAARGTAMADVEPMDGDNGLMAAVAAGVEPVEEVLSEIDGYVVCANKNCHAQTVIGGSTGPVKAAAARLEEKGFDVRMIPVSHAFHTRIVAPASEPLRQHLATVEISKPSISILSNVTGGFYPETPDEIRDLLATQVASPVEFIAEIERLHEEGVRTFVEIGPKRAQTGFIQSVLEGKDIRVFPTNHPKYGGLMTLRAAVGQLIVAGHRPGVQAPLHTPAAADASSTPVVSLPTPTGDVQDTEWPVRSPIVCTGAAVGLPGTEQVFADDSFERLLTGRSLISLVTETKTDNMLNKGITRLQKGSDGTAHFVPVTKREELVKLAGQLGEFNLTEQFGIEERVSLGLDKASQLAFAAGIEALRDAHIPLVPRYRVTRSGKKVTTGVTLPESMRDDTGIILATCFGGVDVAINEAIKSVRDGSYSFDGRYLLQVIAMGHAKFAEFIGARGPNTRINAACASTTQACSMAEDWLRLGRCKRVIVIGGDDVTDETMMPWVGSGFLATGAATAEGDVSKAALPFDKRRNGTILGAGAVALVLELDEDAQKRGVVPLADLLGTRVANSAFHSTRLDVEHIASVFNEFISEAESTYKTERDAIASNGVFVSHETFTPARGGSAAAEVECVRRAFGEKTSEMTIANIKGYTGHPMGAGLEDALAVRMLHKSVAPPIPNLKERDESLGDLRYSDGSSQPFDYAVRFAAGFGSQLALGLWRRRARTEARVNTPVFMKWLSETSGLESPEVYVDQRVLKARPARPSAATAVTAPAPTPAVTAPEPVAPKAVEIDPTHFTVRTVNARPFAEATSDAGTIKTFVAGKSVIVVGGSKILARRMMTGLASIGTSVHLLTPAEASDEAKIKSTLEATGDNLAGIVNLLAVPQSSKTSPAEVRSAAMSCFKIARAIQELRGGVPTDNLFWLTVTRLGGRLGTEGCEQPLLGGAMAGFTKSLAREWADIPVRVVDIDTIESIDPFVVLTTCLTVEAEVEVGLEGDKLNHAVLESAPENSPVVTLGANTRWLMTGGGRGITARIAAHLAERFGGEFILTGRTPMTLTNAADLDLTAERARIKAELKAEGGRVTPKVINKALKPIVAQKEIAQTLKTLESLGAKASYLAFDVCDDVATARHLGGLQDVDICIHGAGLEDSHLLAQKSPEIFDRVLTVKLDGSTNLLNALGDSLGLFVGFTSVSGRFGNAGQVDYAAANDALARLCASLNAAEAGPKGLAIDWTAWADVGMATRGSVATVLEHMGVEMLPPSIGAKMVGDMMAFGTVGEVVAAGALGALGGAAAMAGDATGADQLFDSIVLDTNGLALTARVTLDPTKVRFLADHAIDGTPVLPGVFGMELFSRAARQLATCPRDLVFENVAFARPVKCHKGAPISLEVTVERDGEHLNLALFSERTLRTGRVDRTEHFTGRISLAPAAPAGDAFVMTSADLDRVGPDAEGIYSVFFHTGSFRLLNAVPYAGRSGLVATGTICDEDPAPGLEVSELLSDPFGREAAFQAAGLHAMAHQGHMFLPAAIGRATVYHPARAGQDVFVRVLEIEGAPEGRAMFDAEIWSTDGALLQRLEGLQMIDAGPLPAGRSVDLKRPRAVASRRCDIETAKAEFANWGQPLSEHVTPDDLAAHDRQRSEHRRAEWLAARVAAKALCAEWLHARFGVRPPANHLLIRKDSHGAPFMTLRGPWSEKLPSDAIPALSLSHSDGVAIAAIALDSAVRVGIDIERIAARPEGFAETWLAELERELPIRDDQGTIVDEEARLTALWCLKEATTKALGLGFHLAVSEVVITGVDERGFATLSLTGEAASRLVALGAQSVRAMVRVDPRFAIAESIVEVDARHVGDDPMRLAIIAALLREKGYLLNGSEDAPSTNPPTDMRWGRG
ncbi:MAG: SDR family NAD(P)-dependent oxidoreductase [Myxococcota bacterium]